MNNEQLSTLSPSADTVPNCQHHWVIQDADGPESLGVCRECGTVKQFKNYLATSHWGEDRSRNESRASLLGKPSSSRIFVEDENDF